MIIISRTYNLVNDFEASSHYIIRPENVLEIWDIERGSIGIIFIYNPNQTYKIDLEPEQIDNDDPYTALEILEYMISNSENLVLIGKVYKSIYKGKNNGT